jgi:UDP-N-acetylglucosamine diphosphorylase / glucose-1-phosphate thymidylyltransferase / UDP-N-acetylgalactosamine diphosphorylase / glucosamine-1-phosphate N-acetyltransferase / galactosamine-1-phosphate N-acetyltransferase
MAGRGSRFAETGVDVPKPLIDVRGKPMYSWAVDSLPLSLARSVIFICLHEHLQTQDLEADIRSRYAHLNPVLLSLNQVTEGQACTVLAARDLIDSDEPLLIYNADTYCRSALTETLSQTDQQLDGLIGVFQAAGDKWSFARMDKTGYVVETAEKRRISDWATTGLYYFSKGRNFVRYADEMIAGNDRVNGEFYVAPVYNRMIAAGAHVRADKACEVWVLGTPEDLAHFDQNYAQ